jgi:putative heme-binding domain-containing protein
VSDKNGKPVVDLAGNVVNDDGKPYRQGMVFRCNLDGSQFETLAHNFRNNYEVAIDSFGTLWQSDNDDDGNRGVRINYVMEFGNYGYVDELTGAGWQTPRTNIESETPLRHWHLNDPGVMPNLIQTGAGSPTGICVNEGSLLPEIFQNQVIHSDAGPNIVRSYPVKESGAGYTAEMVNIVEGLRDRWFRPSDVCIAPDGSLIVADWYDPGVGGHGMGDIDKGRIFRVAPPGEKYAIPKYDFTTVEGAIAGLKSPNQEARYLAWTALHDFGARAESALASMFKSDPNPRFRARALWLLSKLPAKGTSYLQAAVNGDVDDLKVVAIRAGRELNPSWSWTPSDLAGQSPKVRRELAIALRFDTAPAPRWASLAKQYQGDDRWYLEALGIAAGTHWDECLAEYLKLEPTATSSRAGRDIIWRSRATRSPELLAEIISNPSTPTAELPRYFRAFDFLTGAGKRAAIERLAFETSTSDETRQALIVSEAINRLEGLDLSAQPERLASLEKVLDRSVGTSFYVTIVNRFGLQARYPQLVKLAMSQPDSSVAVEAIKVLINRGQQQLLKQGLSGSASNLESATSLARALGNAADQRTVPLLLAVVDDKDSPLPLAREAARGLGKTPQGARELLREARDKTLSPELTQAVAFSLQTASFNDDRLKQEIATLFPPPPARNDQPLPPLSVLLNSKGDATRGKQVFTGLAACNSCHVVDGVGKEVGPNLSEIGSKLSREAFFESILFPSAGISHNYESRSASTVNGNVYSGIKVSETPTEIVLRGIDSITRTLKKSEIDELKKQSISLMPADLQKTMTPQELIDVVEYIQTLKKK